MNRFHFKGRWLALGFVAITLIGAYGLIGREGDSSVLTRMQGDLAGQEQPRDRPIADAESPPPDQPKIADYQPDDSVGFTPEEELMDDAAGFDPTPVEEFDPFNNPDPDMEVGEELPLEGPAPSNFAPPPPPRQNAGPVEQSLPKGTPKTINGIPVRVDSSK